MVRTMLNKKPKIVYDNWELEARQVGMLFEGVKKAFVDRTGECEAIKHALVAGQHVLLEGPPGTAKTELGNAIFDNIEEAEIFSTACAKKMTEEYLIGGLDMKVFREEGRVFHVTTKSMVTAHFAFLDEFMDLPDVTLRSLLGILNEREFNRPWQKERARLHSAIATTNYTRLNDLTDAVYDRFLTHINVGDVTTTTGRMSMYKKYLKGGTKDITKVHLNAIRRLTRLVKSNEVTISDDILSVYDKIIHEVGKSLKFRVSPRRANLMLTYVKASAVLNGRLEVEPSDLAAVKFCLIRVNDSKQEAAFVQVHGKETQNLIRIQKELDAMSDHRKGLEKVLAVYDPKMKPEELLKYVKGVYTVVQKLDSLMKGSEGSLQKQYSVLLEKAQKAFMAGKKKLKLG